MIVGVDVSSHRVDLAWIEAGKPQRWHQELAKGHLIDRLRSIDIRWPAGRYVGNIGDSDYERTDVTDVAIEYPYARQHNAIAALMAVTGIITRQAPPWARVAWPSTGELRAAIGARNTKQDAHRALLTLTNDARTQYLVTPCLSVADWNEHELDALVACTGWTRILEQQDAA